MNHGFLMSLRLTSDESSYATPLAFNLAEYFMKTVVCSHFFFLI